MFAFFAIFAGLATIGTGSTILHQTHPTTAAMVVFAVSAFTTILCLVLGFLSKEHLSNGGMK